MNYMDDSDEVLIGRHALGDGAAFELIFRRYELRTWHYLERNVESRAVADELMQDVWFTVAREAPNYEPKGRFATWLFGIAHQRIDAHVKASRGQPTPTATPVSEEQSALTKALAQLPREPRNAYLLQVEGELTVEEISAVTHCATEMTRARLLYARTMLSELLAEHEIKQSTGTDDAQRTPAAVVSTPSQATSTAAAVISASSQIAGPAAAVISAPRQTTSPAAPTTQIYAAFAPAQSPRAAAQPTRHPVQRSALALSAPSALSANAGRARVEAAARLQNLNSIDAVISRGGNTESTSPADTPSASQAISVPRNDTLVAAAASTAATNPAVATPPVLPVVPAKTSLEFELWLS
jgi:RNA polymerase sigma-70 factor (ECF subfamily)